MLYSSGWQLYISTSIQEVDHGCFSFILDYQNHKRYSFSTRCIIIWSRNATFDTQRCHYDKTLEVLLSYSVLEVIVLPRWPHHRYNY